MVPVIVIPVLNRYDLLERCIRTIDYAVEHLIIIDNGGMIEKDCLSLPKNSNIENRYVLDMPSNLGVATSWNLGIKMTPSHRVGFFSTRTHSSSVANFKSSTVNATQTRFI